MLLAYRLVRLIETHSDELAAGLLEKLRQCPQTCSYGDVPAEEFRQRVQETYQHLGEWLLGKTESDIERRYVEIGARRCGQGVQFSQLVCALSLVKEHLIEFLKREAIVDKPVEVLGELEVLQLLEQFFDRAVYYAALGYERAYVARAATAVHHK
ncbi:MAG TPA: hypothetical protein VD837_01170 [Terriglobales bacterium]|nr:hypothetical protein [Terriglobales bacterium]